MAKLYKFDETTRSALLHEAAAEGNMYGNTFLCLAAHWGNLHAVEFFISNRANIDVVCTNGWSPLKNVAVNGHVDVMKCLIYHGAKDFDGLNVYEIDSMISEITYSRMGLSASLSSSVKEAKKAREASRKWYKDTILLINEACSIDEQSLGFIIAEYALPSMSEIYASPLLGHEAKDWCALL